MGLLVDFVCFGSFNVNDSLGFHLLSRFFFSFLFTFMNVEEMSGNVLDFFLDKIM